MKSCVLLILIVCAFAAANVPMDRTEAAASSQNTETTDNTDTTDTGTPTETTQADTHTYCAKNTPCAWTVYTPMTRIIQTNMTNSYCICRLGSDCVVTEDDKDTHSYVYRCRFPEEIEP